MEQGASVRSRSRDDAFKDLLMKLSHNMSDENVQDLLMVGDLQWPVGPAAQLPKAINVLQALWQQGKFSPASCENMDGILRRISRCDLAELVHRYMDVHHSTTTSADTSPEKRQMYKTPVQEAVAGQGEMDHGVTPASEKEGLAHTSLPVQRISSVPEILSRSDTASHRVDQSEQPAVARDSRASSESTSEKEQRPVYRQPAHSMPDVRVQQSQTLPSGLQGNGSASAISEQRLLESQEFIESQTAAISGESIQSFHSSSSQQSSQLPPQINITIGNTNGPVDITISDSSLSPPPVTVTTSTSNSSNSILCSQQQPKGASSIPSSIASNHNTQPPATPKSEAVERVSGKFSALHEVSSSEEHSDDVKEVDGGATAAARRPAATDSHSPRQSPIAATNEVRSQPPGKNKGRWSDAQDSPKEGRKWKKFLSKRGRKCRELTTTCCWVLEKAPLGKYIWNHEHRFGFIKYSKTLPIDLDHGDFNPHLSFLLYPFGLFSDANTNVTLQVKIVVPDNCPPIPITDTFNLSWEILYTRKANSGTGRLFACSKKPLKIPFDRGMIYVHNFLPHDRIKQCRCEAFEIHMHTKYCSSEVSSTANETFAQDLESGVTPSGGSVTLPKLLGFKLENERTINIAREVGAKYESFGHHLLEGNADRLITHSLLHSGTAATTSQEILGQWLKGNGRRPVNWRTLIETVRAADHELTELADTIERNLHLNS